MEVSNFTVAIAPPIFSQGTEEAKKDSQSRETIPKPAPTSGTPKENHTGSGSTTGTNSLLYTQSQSLIQGAGQQGRGNDKDQGKDREKKSSALSATGKVISKIGTASANSLTQSRQAPGDPAVFSPTLVNVEATLTNNQKNKALHAKISPAVAQKLSKDSLQRLNAIAGRYNSTGSRMLLGQNIDALI